MDINEKIKELGFNRKLIARKDHRIKQSEVYEALGLKEEPDKMKDNISQIKIGEDSVNIQIENDEIIIDLGNDIIV